MHEFMWIDLIISPDVVPHHVSYAFLAAFILIMLYVQNELSFDRYHQNSDRIYRLVRDGRTLTPPPLGQALTDNFAGVEAVARIIQDKNTLVSRADRHFL